MKDENCKFVNMCRYYDPKSDMCRSERNAINDCETYLEFVLVIDHKREGSGASYVLEP